MKKLIISGMLVGLTWALLLTPCLAADGKGLFIEKCGSCHKTNGEAATFAATKYASMQWDRFFERNKHQRKKDITALVTASELNDIKEYLVSHAADSDQPEAVGLR